MFKGKSPVTERVTQELEELEDRIEQFTDKEIRYLDNEEVHVFVHFLRELEKMRDIRAYAK